jgi:hypothetical protein
VLISATAEIALGKYSIAPLKEQGFPPSYLIAPVPMSDGSSVVNSLVTNSLSITVPAKPEIVKYLANSTPFSIFNFL